MADQNREDKQNNSIDKSTSTVENIKTVLQNVM